MRWIKQFVLLVYYGVARVKYNMRGEISTNGRGTQGDLNHRWRGRRRSQLIVQHHAYFSLAIQKNIVVPVIDYCVISACTHAAGGVCLENPDLHGNNPFASFSQPGKQLVSFFRTLAPRTW